MLKTVLSSLLLYSCFIFEAAGQLTTNHLDLDGDVGEWYDTQFGIHHSSLAIGVSPFIKSYGKSNPLFNEGQWYMATIKYQGQVYDNINALYNLEEDYLAIKHPLLADEMIKLESKALEWFRLDEKQFVYLADVPTPGIYQSLYVKEGNRLYKKLSKELLIDQDNHAKVYDFQWSYLISDQNDLIDITRKKDIVSVFSKYRKTLRRFIRTNRLTFKSDSHDANWITLIKSHSKWMSE